MKALFAALILAAPVLANVPASVAIAQEAPAASAAVVNAASADALRKWVDGAVAGQPDYALLSPSLADRVRPQMAGMQSLIQRFGAVQSVEHVGVEGEADVFVVRFATAATRWTVTLDAQGLISGLRFRPEG